jgi:hypothetical protein
VKQYGGFNDLCQEIATYDFKFCGDKSGWDRTFPLLKEIYELRKKYLVGLTPEEEERLDEVISDIVEHVVVLKDGSMYVKNTGNPSGSNQTTEDNSMGNNMIHFYLFCRLWLHYHGCLPTLEEIAESAKVNVYGDDDFGGYHTSKFTDDPKDFAETFEGLYHLVHQEFGMTVKFLKIEMGLGLKCVTKGGEMEFLGSSPLEVNGFFHAKPSCAHLATSLITCMKTDEPEAVVSKIRAAYDLTFLIRNYDVECELVSKFAYRMAEHYLNEASLCVSDKHFLAQVLIGKYDPARS